ncbi:hypothetical protein QT327_00930 [Olivibacter sp. 47]|uniref:hypothetical protein n=1 Tax=Olivibacter sp. 47 TaxID=3056486 RepID=UPI0025A3CCC0|nr:hypothetical protein [Olivibacter sp. 47]MDM8172920.1 hypothetical protein [Olivibacter sp. 47]
MRVFVSLLISLTLPILIIYGLWAMADLPNKKDNGFHRKILMGQFEEISRSILKKQTTAILGTYGKYTFLETDDPRFLLKFNNDSYQTSVMTIGNFSPSLGNKKYKYQLLGAQLYRYDRSGEVEIFNLDNNIPKLFSRFEAPPVIYYVPISDNRYGYLKYTGIETFKQFCIGRFNGVTISCDTGNAILSEPKGLIADGQLNFDDSTQTFVYTHYYKNEVTTFDTSLHLKNIVHTIDTVTNSLKEGENGARFAINQKSCVHDGLLYISSNLKADNESRSHYTRHIPIDIYDIKAASYSGSFYLPVSKGKLIKSMKFISRYKILVLYHSNELRLFTVRDLFNL